MGQRLTASSGGPSWCAAVTMPPVPWYARLASPADCAWWHKVAHSRAISLRSTNVPRASSAACRDLLGLASDGSTAFVEQSVTKSQWAPRL